MYFPLIDQEAAEKLEMNRKDALASQSANAEAVLYLPVSTMFCNVC